jgi:uncharacterized protein
MKKKISALLLSLITFSAIAQTPVGIPQEKPVLASVQAAADAGDANSLFQLGVFYLKGDGVTQSFEKTVELWTKSADKGNLLAKQNLAFLYLHGKGVDKNSEKGMSLLKEAADSGLVTANYNLGLIYYEGKLAKANKNQALEWFAKAGNLGFLQAQQTLATIYEDDKELEKAAVWYLKAAENNYSQAQTRVGVMYHTGNGLEKNLDLAISWLTKAALQKNIIAEYYLANIYSIDKKDETAAIKWWQIAADHGHPNAQEKLALKWLRLARVQKLLPEQSENMKKNYEEAISLLSKASEQGKPMSQYVLGDMYNRGEFVEKNDRQAFFLLEKSGHQGNREAQYLVAQYFEKGIYVPQDTDTANYWFEEAAKSGNTKALEALIQSSVAENRKVDTYKWSLILNHVNSVLSTPVPKNLKPSEKVQARFDANKWINTNLK